MNKLKLVANGDQLVGFDRRDAEQQAVETNLLYRTVTMLNAAMLFGTLIIGCAVGVQTAIPIASIAKRTARTASD